MYSTRSGLILGFHGCDAAVAQAVINGDSLKYSTNNHDWLGHGIYMWDNSLSRAREYAISLKQNPGKATSTVKNPAVVGSVIDLGYCLDLLDFENLKHLKDAYHHLFLMLDYFGIKMPKNKTDGNSQDLLLRKLDCYVIEMLHTYRLDKKQTPFDSVRAVFTEGKELYENAGFREKDHIQICIRNPNCLKGYFLPRPLDERFNRV